MSSYTVDNFRLVKDCDDPVPYTPYSSIVDAFEEREARERMDAWNVFLESSRRKLEKDMEEDFVRVPSSATKVFFGDTEKPYNDGRVPFRREFALWRVEEEEVKNYEHKIDCDGNLIVWLKKDKQCEKGGRSFFVVRKDGHSMEVYDHQPLYYSGRKLRDIAWAAFGKPEPRIKELLRVDQYLSVITQSEDRYIGQVGRIEDTRFLLVYKQSSLSDVGQWIYYHDVCDILDAGLDEVIYPTDKGSF